MTTKRSPRSDVKASEWADLGKQQLTKKIDEILAQMYDASMRAPLAHQKLDVMKTHLTRLEELLQPFREAQS